MIEYTLKMTSLLSVTKRKRFPLNFFFNCAFLRVNIAQILGILPE